MSIINENLVDKKLENEHISQVPSPEKWDSSLENLQNVVEDGLKCSEKSVACVVSATSKEDLGPLPKDSRKLSEIRGSLAHLITQCEADEEEEAVISYSRVEQGPPGEVERSVLVAHALAARLASSGVGWRVAEHLAMECSGWLGSLFGLPNASASFNGDAQAGLLQIARRLLQDKGDVPFSILVCDGETSPAHLAAQLGLPLACVTAVSSEGSEEQLTEKVVQWAENTSHRPLLVVSCSLSLAPVCAKLRVWLHVHSHATALIPLHHPSSPCGDSMTLQLGDWIGLPSLPYVTLSRETEEEGLTPRPRPLDVLPTWTALQALGVNGLTEALQHALRMADELLHCIEHFPELRILSKKLSPPVKTLPQDELKGIPLQIPIEACTELVFQYIPKSPKGESCSEKNPPYFDNLNSWLVQLMARHVPRVKTEILDSPAYGVCLCICPLQSGNTLGTTKKDVEQYLLHLQQQIAILNATVCQRERLREEHQHHPRLQVVEVAHWAGMGALRYIPEHWVGRLNELTDTGKADINQLNAALVTKLKDSDSAFSLGECGDGMACVRLGMVDEHLDLSELLGAVEGAGDRLCEENKFFETMSEMVKQGIQEANKELVQENEEKIIKEGVLRQVPLIGSLVSWWSPPPSGISGRSFNLSSGTIESTENIYKYHMQVNTPPEEQ